MTCLAISADGSALTTSPSSLNAAPAAQVEDAEKDRLQELMEGYQRADAAATTELVHRHVVALPSQPYANTPRQDC